MTDKVKECKNTAVDAVMRGAGLTKHSGSGNAKRVRLVSQTRCVYLLMCFSRS